jgi:hypothetical protein
MNYASSESTSRLASGKWRVRHSAWLLAPILGLGLLSFVGFVYVALRVRNRRFWVACAVGCIGSVLSWISNDIAIIVWIGLIVYGFVLNRDYLRWRASRTSADAWYNQPSVASPQSLAASPPKPENRIPVQPPRPTGQGALGVNSASYYSPPVVPPTTSDQTEFGSFADLLDANRASRDELASMSGVDMPLADRVVSARERQGGFRDLDDMVRKAALQPHELIRFRGLVTFGPVSQAPGASTDRPGIRRLDY